MKKQALLILMLGTIMSSSATLAAQGGYIGAGIGRSNIDDETGFDESDTGFKLFGGYRANENVAFEAFYADFGEPDMKEFGAKLSEEVTGFGVQVVGIAPLANQFELFGKLGLIFWDEDFKVNGTTTYSDDGTDLTFGFGGAFTVNPQFSIRVEWEFYAIEDSVGDLDTDLLSVGLQFNF